MTGEVARSIEISGLVAINTAFGWTLQGPSRQRAFLDCDANVMVCVLRVETITDGDTISQIVQSFCQLEAMGITNSGEPPSTESIACFRGTIRKKNGRYIVALPWKDKKQLLGSNRDSALTRLQKLEKRLSMNER
ncbi:hypothetical protein HPB49_010892 [Dermacentor silvarum]|uniref:Uncharacterized protein n=1 Tax=Dermacentor silvarum TaxID=543639 RepID=A0ACB8DPN5_DERSI|nr:hypothetical protein HPB49_010892 [Dermacentor silvarum]